MKKKKGRFVRYKHPYMKATIFNEDGRRLYTFNGNPKECIKDLIFSLNMGLQVIDKKDVLEPFKIDKQDIPKEFVIKRGRNNE